LLAKDFRRDVESIKLVPSMSRDEAFVASFMSSLSPRDMPLSPRDRGVVSFMTSLSSRDMPLSLGDRETSQWDISLSPRDREVVSFMTSLSPRDMPLSPRDGEVVILSVPGMKPDLTTGNPGRA
jgi:hypothetical protein